MNKPKKKKEKVDSEIVEQPQEAALVQTDPSGAEAFIATALEMKAPVETIEKLLSMRTQLKNEYAKEQFYIALAKFQGECPTIEKTRGVPTKSGAEAYKYAPLDTIINQVKLILQRHGFSYTITTEVGEGVVKSICHIHHRVGHSESSEMEVPVGAGTSLMSESQKVAAASTFAKRYAFLNAFGIMTGDEDNEQALQDPKSFQTDSLNEARGRLAKSKTEAELLKAWSNLPAASKREPKIKKIKNDLKAKLADDKARNEDLEGARGDSGMTKKEEAEIIEQERKEAEVK